MEQTNPTPIQLAGVAGAVDPLGNHPSHVGDSHIPNQNETIDLHNKIVYLQYLQSSQR